MKIGLALGGGGARSLCQIGIIKVFEREGIKFDIITGVSMGSLIGSVYAFTQDSEILEEHFLRFISDNKVKKIENFFTRHRKRGFFKRIQDGIKDLYLLFSDSFRTGIFKGEEILEGIRIHFEGGEVYFENSKIPLGVIAVEYKTGKVVIFNKGKLIPTVVASCAIPGLITPVEINGKKYIDGGVASTVPVISNYILGGEIVICVENESSLSKTQPLNAFNVLLQAEKIKNRYTTLLEGSCADLKIEVNLEGVEWFNFSQFKRCVKEGEKIAEKVLPSMEKILYEKKDEFIEIRKEFINRIEDKFSTESSM